MNRLCVPDVSLLYQLLKWNIHSKITYLVRLGLVADPVIEAIARPEFEDGFKVKVFPEGYWATWWLHQAQDQLQAPFWVWVGPGSGVVVIMESF